MPVSHDPPSGSAHAKLLPAGLESLPTLSDAVVHVLHACDQPDASINTVASLLEKDPIVAAKVLRVANSCFFSGDQPIASVSRAVMRLGLVAVRNLVLGMAVQRAVETMVAGTPHRETMWRHAVAVAAGSQLIAESIGYADPQEAFVAGLLHDVGQVAMVSLNLKLFESTCRATSRRAAQGRFLDCERICFGMDHAEAGQKLLEHWGLPESLCRVAGEHHQAATADTSTLTLIVIVADALAQRMGYGFDFAVSKSDRDIEAAAFLNLNPEDALKVACDLEERVYQAQQILDCGASVGEGVSTAERTVWWTSQSAGLGPVLLRLGGMEVRSVSVDEALERADRKDWIVFDEETAPTDEDFTVNCHRVIMQQPTPNSAGRRYEAATKECFIASGFTFHDVQWMHEVLAA